MSVDLFTDDLEVLHNDELCAAIKEFATAQPVEGWRLDYTQQWDDSSLKTVAAFANTFGGSFDHWSREGPERSGL